MRAKRMIKNAGTARELASRLSCLKHRVLMMWARSQWSEGEKNAFYWLLGQG